MKQSTKQKLLVDSLNFAYVPHHSHGDYLRTPRVGTEGYAYQFENNWNLRRNVTDNHNTLIDTPFGPLEYAKYH